MLSILAFIPSFISVTLTAIIFGVLIRLGYANAWVAIISIIVGDVISNIFWYSMGRVGNKVFLVSLGRLFGIDQKSLDDGLNTFNKFKDIVGLFATFSVGLVIMIISQMDAGLRKLRITNYVLMSTLATIIWTFICIYTGYGIAYAFTIYTSIWGIIITSISSLIIAIIMISLGSWIRSMISTQRSNL
jgi:membrane protein DedA with SNARE-associated domain